MALDTNVRASYHASGIWAREDLLDFITQISPEDTPVLSMLQRVPASFTKHEWDEETLAAATTLGALEGDGFSGEIAATPARRFNFTQITRKDYAISGTMDAIDTVGGQWTGHSAAKALKEIALLAEIALVTGNMVNSVGADATRRQMGGLWYWLSSAATFTSTSTFVGATFDEAGVVELIKRIWSNGPFRANTIITSAAGKSTISGFTTTLRVHHSNGPSDPRMLIRNVQVYESDFGVCEVYASRYVGVGGASTTPFGHALDRNYFRTAWLRPPQIVRLGQVGDSTRLMAVAELTLEALSSRAGGSWITT